MTEPRPVEPAAGSSIGNLVRTLVSPREAFAALAVRPRFALALAVVALTAAGAVYLSMGRVDAAEMMSALEEQGQQFPPELRDDPERIKKMSVVFGSAWALVAFPALLAIQAGVFLVLFRLLGSEIAYRQSAAVTVHGSLPMAVAALVGVAVVLGRGEVGFLELQWGGVVASNLGVLAHEDTSQVMRALLTSVDLFSAWCVALQAIGYRVVARVSPGAAWTSVLAVWAVGILIKLAIAAAT